MDSSYMLTGPGWSWRDHADGIDPPVLFGHIFHQFLWLRCSLANANSVLRRNFG